MNESQIIFVKKIVIFGDIHGNLEGLINTVKFLEDSNGEKYPLIFQVGDFGYFVDLNELKKNLRSESESGVYNYLHDLNKQREVKRYFEGHRIFFIRGNHEDQKTLKGLESNHYEGPIPVDNVDLLYYLPSGRGISLPIDPLKDIIISGLGGISRESRPKSYSRNPLISFSDEDLDSLFDMCPIDILLTHQGPDYVVKGSRDINAIIELVKPKLHIFGHSHKHYPPTMNKQGTIVEGLEKMPLKKRPYLIQKNFYTIVNLESL